MSKNYIEIDENIVKIHKDGKVCTLTNPNSIKILLDVCHKNNFYFKSKKATLRNADKVIREFDSYRANQNKDTNTKKSKLNISYKNIKKLISNTKLVRMNPIEKTVLVTGLATVIGFASMGLSNTNDKSDKNYISLETQSIIEELPEYIPEEETEVITPTINIQDDLYKYDMDDIYNEDGIIIKESEALESSYEINKMVEENDAFHFEYNDRSDEDSLTNAKRYEDLFNKYGNYYGVDPSLLMAMAAQESSGNHYDNLGGNYGIGIMQIEKCANLNSTVKAYNFETGEIDSVKITEEALEDLETNIQIGTIILRNRIEENNYNIPLALQSYNFGAGNMSKVINACCDSEGLTRDDIRSNCINPEWLDYRTVISVGDSQYVEHVFSYVPNNTVLTIKDRDGNDHSLKIINDTVHYLDVDSKR